MSPPAPPVSSSSPLCFSSVGDMQEAARQRPDVLCAARVVKVHGRQYDIDPSGEVHEKVCWLRRCWRYCFGSREAGRREEHVAGILEQARATLSAQAARGWSGEDSARGRVSMFLGLGEHTSTPQSPPIGGAQLPPQHVPQPFQGPPPSPPPSESSLGSPPPSPQHAPRLSVSGSESSDGSLRSCLKHGDGKGDGGPKKQVRFSIDDGGNGDDNPAFEEDSGEGTSSGTGGDGS